MDFDNNIPIYLQVINDIKKDIVNGVLVLGEKMPSGRDLALKYKINPNTANRIYKELEAEGICFTKRGLGTYVTEEKEKVYAIRDEMAGALLVTFIAGTKNLGFSKDEVIHMIEKEYDKK
jgi:DNA-binding transcriptional regulator YhcF (GntR family)